MKKRVEFSLTMPGVSTWNGRWSGEGRNYTIVRNLTENKISELLCGKATRSWYHRWDDGWTACVTMRILQKGERKKKSNGFLGYEWMVSDILDIGRISK